MTPLNQGATNDTAADIIRKHVSSLFRFKKFWTALVEAIAKGDEIVQENNRLAFDQLYKCTASGEYLTRRCADFGIALPEGLGLDEDVFRQLAISITAHKLSQEALLEILETFYGSDSTRAWLQAGAYEPYDLSGSQTIAFLVDEKELVTVSFNEADFAHITSASAAEVASVINRTFNYAGLQAFADTKSEDGKKYVAVYSGAIGLAGALRVVSGMAQDVLQFPTLVSFEDVGDVAGILIGDWVNLSGTTIDGSYIIKDTHFDANTSTQSHDELVWLDLQINAPIALNVGETLVVTLNGESWQALLVDYSTLRLSYLNG